MGRPGRHRISSTSRPRGSSEDFNFEEVGLGSRKLKYVSFDDSRRTRRASFGSYIFVFLLFIVIFLSQFFGESTYVINTKNRERLTENTKFDSECILDEEGWIGSKNKVVDGLEYFYDKTGINSYIAILSYNDEYATDEQREQYTVDLYNKLFDDEYHFLFTYFAASEPNAVGYMCYASGKQVDSIMDDEAIDIFCGYVDKYYYSNLTTEDMFVSIFKNTADKIMTKSVTGKNIVFVVLAIVALRVLFLWVLKIMKVKRQHEKEKAEETERILNTPVEKLHSDLDDLEDKYN